MADKQKPPNANDPPEQTKPERVDSVSKSSSLEPSQRLDRIAALGIAALRRGEGRSFATDDRAAGVDPRRPIFEMRPERRGASQKRQSNDEPGAQLANSSLVIRAAYGSD
jgi:hypothetical protein